MGLAPGKKKVESAVRLQSVGAHLPFKAIEPVGG